MSHTCQPCKRTHVRLELGQEYSRLRIYVCGGRGKWYDHEILPEVGQTLLSSLCSIVRPHCESHAKGLVPQVLDLFLELSPASTPGCDAPECCARKE